MMNRRSQGFTLIELVVVIAILSILAAIALPRFAALQADARLAKMNAAMGSVKSAAAMAHGLLIARGHGESFSGTPEPRIIIEGQEVNYRFGYPTVETIAALAGLHEPDYVVLAKYMRVLTPEFVARFPNKIINIHHSFLPAFIGARPYHQAYERGVKIIGATAHYVNDNLDEGPIIMQDVIHVDHTYTAEDMMRAGRDVEKNVLSRALYQVLAQRVFVYGNRTIIL